MKRDYLIAFENTVNQFVDTYKAQGLIVGIFDADERLYQETFGYRDVEHQKSIDGDTIFGIASITKSFTAVRLMQLVEQGVIDLDMTLDQLYEDWALPKMHTPTVRHLLSHAAGFYPQERFLMNDVAEEMGVSETELHHSEVLSKRGIEMIIKRLNRAKAYTGMPGEYFSYSNFSFGILTDLVERFSEESTYAESVMAHVIEPMGLKNTFFDFVRTKDENNITTLYTAEKDGVKSTDDYTDSGFVLLGGGALKSTFNDLMCYTRFYMQDGYFSGQQILGAKWLGEMLKQRISYKDGQGYGYALVTGQIDDLNYVGHSGGLTGVSSFFGFCKESGKGVVVLCNTGGVPATAIGIAALRLAHDRYPAYQIGDYSDVTWSSAVVDHTLGVYQSEEGDRAEVIFREGKIKMLVNGNMRACRTVRDDLILIVNEMEENHCRILRDKEGVATGLYLGSRIIPKIE